MKSYYTSKGINASTLKMFAGDYFNPVMAVHKMNTPMEPTQSMALGSAMHAFLEHEMDEGEAEQIVSDAYKTAKPREAALTKARTMATNIWETCAHIVQHPKANREKAHFTDEYKALVDLEVEGIGYDYKSTKATSLEECKREANKYFLEVQAWHYFDVTKLKGFEFIFCSSVEPHPVFHLKCTHEYLHDFAKPRWEQALKRYHEYKDMTSAPLLAVDSMDVPDWFDGF